MPLYAVCLLGSNGDLIAAAPEGVQFDSNFLIKVYQQESARATPNPVAADMGGGFWFIGLWTGEKPAFVLPKFIVGIVADGQENQEDLKKQMRKITNNVLIHYQTEMSELANYLTGLWANIEQKQFDLIKMEKMPTLAASSVSPPAEPITPVINSPIISAPSTASQNPTPNPVNNSSKPPMPKENFDDLLDLSVGVGKEAEVNPFDADPFSKPAPKGTSSTVSNPFGPSSAQDPFGGSIPKRPGSLASTDPFGGPTPVPKKPLVIPKASTGAKPAAYNPALFGNVSVKNTNTKDPFAENPFEAGSTEKPVASSSPEGKSNEFSDNPFETTPPPKKPEKKADEFSDNPW